jgi:hypothetical protein
MNAGTSVLLMKEPVRGSVTGTISACCALQIMRCLCSTLEGAATAATAAAAGVGLHGMLLNGRWLCTRMHLDVFVREQCCCNCPDAALLSCMLLLWD